MVSLILFMIGFYYFVSAIIVNIYIALNDISFKYKIYYYIFVIIPLLFTGLYLIITSYDLSGFNI